MEKVIKVGDFWYIPTTSSRADDRVRVLKSDDGFAVLSRHGEIGWAGLAEQGFYFLGTRHLSRWHLSTENHTLILLNSTVRLDNNRLIVDQTNPDIYRNDELWLPKDCIHFRRELATHRHVLSEHLKVANFYDDPRRLRLQYSFTADFADIFEVRGVKRKQKGQMGKTVVDGDAVILSYTGLDAVTRRTRIGFNRTPDELESESACFELDLEPGESFILEASICCDCGGHPFFLSKHQDTVDAIDRDMSRGDAERAKVWTDNEQFNDWINRSNDDLLLLTTETRHGLYPYAGIPWFATPFGRDGLITALQTLWGQPGIARGVLAFLAATQAQNEDPINEAEPGKILHELREGEMAALGEIPFRRYYGTVDATPLFVVLAGRYFGRTHERAFIEQLWPNIQAALNWIVTRRDEHGFLTYQRHGERGLVHQGWKDSNDSVFHRDGRPAKGPIALCEVQGYACEAFYYGAELTAALGRKDEARQWSWLADQLRQRIDSYFWSDDLGTYALALDGDGAPCRIRTSNAAHLLYSGVATPARAARVAKQLTSTAAYNGWGLRTVFAGEPRYNPMSYHNGSIWPHDTAIAVSGLSRYDFKREALTLIEGLFNAAIMLDQNRLPELFCGFEKIPGQAPTLYPSACSPQAWASGAVFMLIEAMLGLKVDASDCRIHLSHPQMPDYLNWLRIQNLRCGDGAMDLIVRRHDKDVGVNIENRQGEVSLSVEM